MVTETAERRRLGPWLAGLFSPQPLPEPGPAPDADPPLMRFLTLGGAVVEVVRYRFTTDYLPQGRPFVGHEGYRRDVDGFRWACRGCGCTGKHNDSYDPGYLDSEESAARDDANAHAAACRSMPRPAGG